MKSKNTQNHKPLKQEKPKAPKQKKSFFSIFKMKLRYKILSLIVILLAVAYYCTPSLECIVKNLVHQYGSQFLGTEVSLEGFEFSPFSGNAALKGLRIANPKGYKAPDLFYLGEIRVGVDVKSLLSDTIVIKSINISKPEFTYEMLSFTKNNVSDLLNHLQAQSGSSESTPAQTKAPEKESAESSSGKKVIIKSLVIDDGSLSAMAGFANMKKALTLPLPSIQLSNIGEENNGASVMETISTVLHEVLNTVSQTALNALGGVKDFGKAALENVKGAADGLKDSAQESAKGFFKGLFN